MQFSETVIPGVWIIDTIKNGDSRGYFSRAWCKQEFNKHGVTGELSQANLSFSKIRYTLRGLHYQKGSDAEMKAVRCMKGSIFDVAVDLRSESTTFMKLQERSAHKIRRMISAKPPILQFVGPQVGHGRNLPKARQANLRDSRTRGQTRPVAKPRQQHNYSRRD